MDVPTVLIGVAAILYGVYTAWARRARPQRFKKLDAMKQAWGPLTGSVVHVIGYTIVPITVGAVLLWTGLRGQSLR